MSAPNRNGTYAPVKPEQMAPHSVEAEEATLGSVLLNPDALFEVSSFLNAADFFIVRNGWVYEAMRRLTTRKEQIDYLTVIEELRQQERLEEIGGASYITHLVNHTPSSIYAETYGRIVERAAIRRRMLHAASQIARLAHEESADIDDVINQSETALLQATQRTNGGAVKSASDIAARVFSKVEKARESGITGIATGFTDFDHLTGGLQDTDLIIIAGRPGLGKTALLLSIVYYVCQQGSRPLILSKEMSDEQLMQRMIAMDCGVTTHQQRTGKLDDREFAVFTNAVDKLSGFKFHVEDGSNMSMNQLAAMTRREKRDKNINLLVVDYLQLVKGTGENRTAEVGSVATGLKALARELKIPVLAAAQLSRAVENRQDKRPQLSDLRESGEIEQAADIVTFIYRDEVYNENTERPNQADWLIAKHRNGPTGTVELYFRKPLMQFTNIRKTDIDLAGYNRDFDTRTLAAPSEAAD